MGCAKVGRTISAALVLVVLAGSAIGASGTALQDSHHLSADELKTFLPVVCHGAKKTQQGHRCAALPGYGSPDWALGDLDLYAIAYGSFTAKDADEAYLTYSGLEPHARNFGGGILLRRTGGKWSPVKWIPGGQMDRCVAIPGDGTQRMLCLDGYFGQGEADSSVWLTSLGHVPKDGSLDKVSVVKAQDGRGSINPGGYYCPAALHDDVLFSINDLVRSQEAGVLATSKIAYATAADARAACKKNGLRKVKTHEATVRYRLVGGKVEIDPPRKFADVDY